MDKKRYKTNPPPADLPTVGGTYTHRRVSAGKATAAKKAAPKATKPAAKTPKPRKAEKAASSGASAHVASNAPAADTTTTKKD
jgi:hypothetical protein